MAAKTELEITSATGVTVRLRLAGPGARAFGFVLDAMIRGLIAAAWVIGVSYAAKEVFRSSAGSSKLVWVTLLPAALFYFSYHPLFEWLWQGQTPGKRLAGVRLVDAQGRPPQLPAVLVRNVFRIVDSIPAVYAVGLITCIVTDNGVRLGDLAAGTLLIYADAAPDAADFDDRVVRASAAPRIVLVQELIDRWSTLDPHARQGLAIRLLAAGGVGAATGSDDAALLGALRELLHGNA